MKTLDLEKLENSQPLTKLEPIKLETARELTKFSENFKKGVEKSYGSMLKEKRSFGGCAHLREYHSTSFIVD